MGDVCTALSSSIDTQQCSIDDGNYMWHSVVVRMGRNHVKD